MKKNALNKGFTLVEIAIALVLIGLIVSGIIAGQSIIENSTRSSVIQEAARMKTAINAYRLEYSQLPGDHNEASLYFPDARDGDNDGQIVGFNAEAFAFWHHLSLAEIIPVGLTGVVTDSPIMGENLPVAPTGPGDGWYGFYAGITGNGWSNADSPFYGRYGNFIGIGGEGGTQYIDHGVVSGEFAMAIDEKIDDGLPHKGRFFAQKGIAASTGTWINGCVDQIPTVDASVDVNYDLTEGRFCRLIFWY